MNFFKQLARLKNLIFTKLEVLKGPFTVILIKINKRKLTNKNNLKVSTAPELQ